jgi:translocator protein
MKHFLRKWPYLLLALFITTSVQVVNSWITLPNIKGWFDSLNHPFWSPPDWVFGPVWTVLYILIALSLYCVILNHQDRKRFRHAYFAWGMQLFFNALWSPLFFGYHKIFWAFFDITLLWLAIVWTMIAFFFTSRAGMYLLIPYLLWVSYAWTLNLGYYLLNR